MIAFTTSLALRISTTNSFVRDALDWRQEHPSITTPTTKGLTLTITNVAGGPTPPGAEGDKDDDFLERIRSINRTMNDDGSVSDEDVDHLLNLVTKDKNPQVRYAALSRLSNIPPVTDENVINRLLQAARHVIYNDSESSCKAASADLIAGMKIKDGFEDLVKVFNETNDWVLQFSIVSGLGEMKHPQSFQFLSEVLELENNEALVTAACIGALGDLGDTNAIPIIEKYKSYDDESIKDRANIALKQLEAAAA